MPEGSVGRRPTGSIPIGPAAYAGKKFSEGGTRLFAQAIDAYEPALQGRTSDALPVQWEQTMSTLEIARKALEELT